MDKDLKIFGLGLNKTGTSTLAGCFKLLGIERHLSCRNDLLEKYRKGDIDGIFDVVDQFQSFEDWPYPLMYKELFSRYKDNALFVLTVRESVEKWLESLKRHSLRTHPTFHSRNLAYGYPYPHGYEKEHSEIYENHNRTVKDFFSAEGRSHQLLEVCWERGDGWNELCPFLDVPVPPTPLPHENSADHAAVDRNRLEENSRNIQQQLEELKTRQEPL